MALKVGDVAPDFEVMTQDHTKKVKLSDLKGKKVVLLFYPMDFSPVCTNEHCAFGPQLGEITAGQDAVVFGVSCDSPFTHAAFKKQYNIPYDLLADVNRKIVKAYDMFMGDEPFNCGKRGTIVVGKDGRIAAIANVEILQERKVDDLKKLVSA
jgi:peroxiredoxin